eukprot:1363964-Rhodomonas_salina.1
MRCAVPPNVQYGHSVSGYAVPGTDKAHFGGGAQKDEYISIAKLILEVPESNQNSKTGKSTRKYTFAVPL